jgi:KDO2-lipid IV(A) lauroyltransferase
MPSVAAYRAGSYLSRRMPEVVGRTVARAAGVGSSATGDKRTIVARNLERVLGRHLGRAESRRRVAATFEWYARYYVESFRLPELSAREIDRGFAYEGFGEIDRAVAEGRGPILVLPHLGTWEWAAWWLALEPGMNVTAVVEPLEPPEVFEWFVSFRESLGMNIVPLGPDAGREVVAAIKRNDVVCLLADRDLVGDGVPVEFFGEPTTLPAGPAALALRTGAPILPTAVYWRGSSRHAWVRPPMEIERQGKFRADVARITQALAHELESLIRAAPEQWHMLNPNWPSDYRALGLPVPGHLQGL